MYHQDALGSDKSTVSALYLVSLDWEIHDYAKELQIVFEVKRRIEVIFLEDLCTRYQKDSVPQERAGAKQLGKAYERYNIMKHPSDCI
jgi:hypothetical protein